jgi:predicted alpha/beta-hydrolase family hydrolase
MTPIVVDKHCLVLTHGAGSNRNAPLLVALDEAFSGQGWLVQRCDLAFRQARPQGPPPRGSAELDQQGLREAVLALRKQTTGRVFLGGHSYGGRQASMLVAEEPGLVEGLLLLSYPLHPPQRPSELRTAHFPNLKAPAFFVHGTKDGFGTLDEMAAALPLIPAPTTLLSVAGAGHELLSKKNRAQLTSAVLSQFSTFMSERE